MARLSQVAQRERDRWSPVLYGRRFYCSPACGGDCTWAAHKRAVREAARCASRLGAGWTPEVTENLGWHWEVRRGTMTVRKATAARRGRFDRHPRNGFGATFSGSDFPYILRSYPTPQQAVDAALKRARAHVHNLQRKIAEVTKGDKRG